MSLNEQQNSFAQSQRSDAELVHAIRAGDLECFNELVCRYQRAAVAIAYRLLSNRDDALEVAQDAFLKAFDKLASLGDAERFGAWLLRIVNNLALNKRRGRALRKTAQLDHDSPDPENERVFARIDKKARTPYQLAAEKDFSAKLRAAIDSLPDLQRQALTMFCVEKLPQKQIADIMDCSVEAVKWHVFTGRKKLKEMLADHL